jgi:hypothetical protein
VEAEAEVHLLLGQVAQAVVVMVKQEQMLLVITEQLI